MSRYEFTFKRPDDVEETVLEIMATALYTKREPGREGTELVRVYDTDGDCRAACPSDWFRDLTGYEQISWVDRRPR